MNSKKFSFCLCLFLTFALMACEGDFVPKPKGWNRIDLPEHEYVRLEGHYPYSFEYAKTAEVNDDTVGMTEPFWMQVFYPDFDAEIALSYKPLENDRKRFYEIINDAHKLTSKHQVKAYAIEQTHMQTDNGYTAMLFELSGEVPSQFQFYVTDSVQHFLRGALYFKTATRNDSLAPVIAHIKEDVIHMLNTVKWNDSVRMPAKIKK